MKADFTGYATKYNVKCSDGRTILPGAFEHMDKMQIPLVWQHQHNDPENVLGHAILEHRADGVYAYGYFNDTPAGQNAKALVEHKDIKSLSIWANELIEKSKQVVHGAIRELSLVLAGANIEAYIDNVNLAHADGSVDVLEDEAVIYSGMELEHADNSGETVSNSNTAEDETVQEVFDTLNEKQKNVVYYMLGEALNGASGEVQHSEGENNAEGENNVEGENNGESLQHSEEGNKTMKHNLFEDGGETFAGKNRPTLTHDQLTAIVEDAKKLGSFKEAFLAHAVTYGIENIELLFPDAKAITNAPELVSRRKEWVNRVLSGIRKSPFSRIKSLAADITHEEARAKGYIKGHLKKEEFFGLTRRVTTPTTIYKKQKLDRDDIIDITELDVVAWLKGEMRLMFDEEMARAVLVGDGREVDDEDKVREPASNADGAGIRSIANDDDFYAEHITIAANVTGDAIVEAIVRARPKYRGAGNPTMFCTEDMLTDLLLVKDKMGRRLYPTQTELQTALRVSEIITVPVMESQTTNGGDLLAILVNLSDYTLGADRGGETSFFDDFDIDYNQYKYLYEGRVSGALTEYKSALVFSRATGTMVTPSVPTFVVATGVVTIPTTTGVTYKNQTTDATLTAGAQTAIDPGDTLSVVAVPNTGYYFPHNFDADWDFTRPLV